VLYTVFRALTIGQGLDVDDFERKIVDIQLCWFFYSAGVDVFSLDAVF
jgi:hypothetical protein